MRPTSDDAKRERIESLYQKTKQNFPEVPVLSAGELEGLQREEKVVLVDVRSPQEQAVSMIEGAVTYQDFDQRKQDFEGATVVAYCTVGHRSGLYARNLLHLGWKAFNLDGAILGWTHHGGALVNSEGSTKKVHVWGKKFNLVADGYEGVW
jgi:rhodanese-related sulfurtransferase